MRCKVGDLVILTHATNPVCLHMVGQIHVIGRRSTIPNHWAFEPEVINANGNLQAWRDSEMRPIRDNPGQDETLTWAPHKETA